MSFGSAVDAVAHSMALMCKGTGLSAQTEQHQEEFRRCAKEALRKAKRSLNYSDIFVPSDIQEFGERHNIPTFSDVTYRNGFMDGFRSVLNEDHQS